MGGGSLILKFDHFSLNLLLGEGVMIDVGWVIGDL